jgi:hypothetical protein
MNACDSVMRLQHTPSRSRAALVDDVSTRAGDHAAMGYTSAACRAACILALVAGARAAAVAEPSGSFELDEFPADAVVELCGKQVGADEQDLDNQDLDKQDLDNQ